MEKKFSSEVGFKGIFKKVVIFSLVAVGHILKAVTSEGKVQFMESITLSAPQMVRVAISDLNIIRFTQVEPLGVRVIPVEEKHQPIVTKEEFERVQKLIEEKRPQMERCRENSGIYSEDLWRRKMRCHCGHAFAKTKCNTKMDFTTYTYKCYDQTRCRILPLFWRVSKWEKEKSRKLSCSVRHFLIKYLYGYCHNGRRLVLLRRDCDPPIT